jgi:hypothetical protein
MSNRWRMPASSRTIGTVASPGSAVVASSRFVPGSMNTAADVPDPPGSSL